MSDPCEEEEDRLRKSRLYADYFHTLAKGPMPDDEIRQHYPGAFDLVKDLEAYPRLLINARYHNLTPAKVIQNIRDALDRGKADGRCKKEHLRPYLDHPDFLRYLNAKLGGM